MHVERGPPALDQRFKDTKQDVGVEAALVCLIQHYDGVSLQVSVRQALTQQYAICTPRAWSQVPAHRHRSKLL